MKGMWSCRKPSRRATETALTTEREHDPKGGPARGYSWPPFEKGNTAAMTHGARSDRLVEPRARELTAPVFDANPHLEAARDGAAVLRYCMTLARIERVYRWLEGQVDHVFVDQDAGRAHGVYERLERWERAAGTEEDRLGISPLARTRLGLDRARGQALVEHLERTYGEGKG
jgi:hypothetical protein